MMGTPIVWSCIIKRENMIRLSGVVVIMFCLHEQAWCVCWFDSGLGYYIFSSST